MDLIRQKINAILDKLNSNLKAESKQPICNIESVESMAKDLLFGNTNPTNVNNYKNFVRIRNKLLTLNSKIKNDV